MEASECTKGKIIPSEMVSFKNH